MANPDTKTGTGSNTGPVLAEEIIRMNTAATVPMLSEEPGSKRNVTLPPKPLLNVEQDVPFLSKTVKPMPVTEDGMFVEETAVIEAEPTYQEQAPNTVQVPVKDRLAIYLSRKLRLTFKLNGGTVMMTVIDAVVDTTNIVIIIPTVTDGCVFIPSVGEDVTVSFGGRSYDCTSPGLVAQLDALGITMITLIRQEVVGAGNED